MPNHPQPETLPDTLPLGIKAAGLTLKSDARLVQTPTGPAYAGSWQDGNLLVAWEAPASQVDWGSAPEACACCGGHVEDHASKYWAGDYDNLVLCEACWEIPLDELNPRIIRRLGNAQPSGVGEAPKKEACHDCGALAVLSDYGHCAYCERRMLLNSGAPRRVGSYAFAASQRLEAWSRAEKPRVTNAADQRELRKPHPWAEFDDLESR